MDLIEAGFHRIADLSAFPVDQVRYIVLLFLTYPIALVFRYLLHPSLFSTLARHLVAMSFGLAFGFICFGAQEMFYLFVMVGVSYALLWLAPPSIVQRYTMGWAMACMSAAHIYRLITDTGGYHLDFTGPLMLLVMRVSSVGFALHDGLARRESELTSDQKEQKIDVRPSPLVYASFMFSVFSFLAGPTCTIREYLSFIDGSNLKPLDNPNQYANVKDYAKEPSALYPVVTKLLISLVSIAGYVAFTVAFSNRAPLDPSNTILYQIVISYLVVLKWKLRFYFLFLLTDSIDNAAGLGFSGYDKLGYPKWDLVTNVDILAVELPSNFRSIAVGWNITISRWLRRCCYERVTFSPNLMTFALSACWHGFYPSYYLAFACLALMNEAGKKLRRLVRPHFQGNKVLKLLYDMASTSAALVGVTFAVLPHIWLWLTEGLLFWSQFYYVPLVAVVVIVLCFPSGKKRTSTPPKAGGSDETLHKDQTQHNNFLNQNNSSIPHSSSIHKRP